MGFKLAKSPEMVQLLKLLFFLLRRVVHREKKIIQKKLYNLVAPKILAHRLQCNTDFKMQNGPLGVPIATDCKTTAQANIANSGYKSHCQLFT